MTPTYAGRVRIYHGPIDIVLINQRHIIRRPSRVASMRRARLPHWAWCRGSFNLVIHGYYDPLLVALSYVIATLGSYIALRLSPLAKAPADASALTLRSFLPAAGALGIAIWSMHFTGMAAFKIPGMPMDYRWDLTVMSLVVAIAFTSVGFATLVLLPGDVDGPLLAGVPMAAGILSMHFLGMMAMNGVETRYTTGLVLTSGAIALVASSAALRLSTLHSTLGWRLACAALMGIAICGMHYTGMRAAVFYMHDHDEPSHAAPTRVIF